MIPVQGDLLLHAEHEPGEGCWRVFAGGVEVLTYSYRDEQDPCPSFAGVATLGGTPVGLYRPWDHVWHVGLFFNWKYVNGHNFWESHFHEGSPGRSRVVRTVSEGSQADSPRLEQDIHWVAMRKLIMLERRRFVVTLCPGGYFIDVHTRFEPVGENVTLDVTPASPEKPGAGYAGLSCRLPRSFRKPSVQTSEGPYPFTDPRGRRSRWCDYSGRIDGAEDAWAGVAMFDHPQNPRHPTPWQVYDTSIQFFQAAFLYESPYTIAVGSHLSLRYGVFVHDGKSSSDELETLWQEFAR